MKQKSLLKTMLLLCALVVGSGSAWADDSYTITFANNASSASQISSSTQASTVIANDGSRSYVTAKPFTVNSGNSYYGDNKTSIRIGKSSNSASLSITLSDAGKVKATSIIVNCQLYNSADASTLTVNGLTGQSVPSSAGNVTFNYTNATDIESITLAVTKKIYVYSITVNYSNAPDKTPSNLTITNTNSTIDLAIGGTTTGNITYTTSSDGTMSFVSNNTSVATVDEDGKVTAVAEGSTTITVSQAEGTSYAASNNLTVYVNVSDVRTAVGSITAINPTTVYVGETGSFTLTKSLTGTVSSYAWSLGDGEDEYLTLADEVFEGLKEGNVTITVTATPTDATTYKPVTATFPVTVAYKYAAPSLPAASVFFTTQSITIPAIAGADIYYTLDGSTPTNLSTKYTDTFELYATTTVKAIAIDADGLVSPLATVTYTKEDVLDINQKEVTFTNFSGAGSGYENGAEKNLAFTATDGTTQLKITGQNIMSNNGLQVRSTPGFFTTQYIQNGSKAFSLTATFTNGLSYKISYADGSDDTSGTLTSETAITPSSFPCKFTFTRSSGTPVITKIVLTPLKDPVATNVSINDPGTLAKGATGTFIASSTDVAQCTKAWASSDENVITVDATTGAYEAKGRGTAKITFTITPEDTENYGAVTAELNVNVNEQVVITASDVALAYGDSPKAIGATTSDGYAGTLTYKSGNTSIATVDASGNVTAVATGTTTITISAPTDAEHLYTAGDDKIINVTVNAPTGDTASPEVTEGNIYSTTLKSTPTGWTKDSKWSYDSSYGAVTATGETSGTYDLTSKDINLTGYTDITLKFSHTGKTFATTPSSACKVYIQEGTNDPVQLSISYFTGKDWTYVSSGDVNLNGYKNKTVHFIFRYTPTDGDNGKWEVKDFKITGTPTSNATVATSGYGTYCYEYPLDLDKLDDAVKAYCVTNVSGSTVEFTQITGTIKGGVPFILFGTPGDYTLYTAASSSNVPANNMLVGTLAPKYITTVSGDYTNFGLSSGEFVKIYDGTIPAHKAYLPILTANVPAARLTIVFNEESGIATVKRVEMNETVYDLLGRRVANPVKGGLYIVGGKKVVMK